MQWGKIWSNYFSKITDFCDNDPNDENSLHNNEAANEQNIICQSQSSWQVMRNHEDFINGKWAI